MTIVFIVNYSYKPYFIFGAHEGSTVHAASSPRENFTRNQEMQSPLCRPSVPNAMKLCKNKKPKAMLFLTACLTAGFKHSLKLVRGASVLRELKSKWLGSSKGCRGIRINFKLWETSYEQEHVTSCASTPHL